MPAGPGALDAQGVYLFGEDDTESLASDLLNLLGDSVSAALIVDRLRLTAAEFITARGASLPVSGALGQKFLLTTTMVLYRHNGSTWKEWESDWITWTTAPTNLAVGTGGSASLLQRYKWIAGRIYFEYKYVLGTSGASVGTNPTMTLPISIALIIPGVSLPLPAVGKGAVYDLSTLGNPAYTEALVITATTVRVSTIAAGNYSSITATAPMTWAAGDWLAGGFWADPA